MTTMIAEVYDALKEAGASEDKSRKAAEAIASYDSRFAAIDAHLSGIESRLTALTWVVGLNAAMTLAVLGKLLHG